MYMFMIVMISILLLLMMMMLMNFLISKKMFKNREKMSSFECGFDSMSKNRLPFSLQFFLISIIFLIFDVEIAMVLPMILSMFYLKYYIIFFYIIMMLILIFGLILEWKEGALNWFK